MKRIKTLCIILLLIFFGSLYQGAILPFWEGVKYGLFIAEYESDKNIKTEDFLLMDIVPKNVQHMETSEVNMKTNEIILYRPTSISLIISSMPNKPVWWIALHTIYTLLTIMVLILGIWIPFLVVRILNSLQHSEVFDRHNLKRINKIGIILLIIGISSTVIQAINVISAEFMIELSNYNFSYAKVFDFNAIIMAVIILIMNEVLKVAIEMKEEQDLTI